MYYFFQAAKQYCLQPQKAGKDSTRPKIRLDFSFPKFFCHPAAKASDKVGVWSNGMPVFFSAIKELQSCRNSTL